MDPNLIRSPAEEAELASRIGYVEPPPPIFEAAAHSAYRNDAKASVYGQAFLRQQGGGVVTCAGSPVMLVPDTPYFREAVLKPMFVHGAKHHPMPPDASAMVAKTTCDASGDFEFHNIPRGSWLVATTVAWVIAGEAQGGGLVSKVEVGDSTPRLLMSRRFIWPEDFLTNLPGSPTEPR